MKRVTLGILAVLMLAASTEIHAQGFLKKLKQKAESAVNKVIGADEESETETVVNEENAGKQPTATDRVPKLRQTTFVWDGQVSPSKASTVEQLLNELPPLPSVEQIVNPDDAERQSYYNRLSSISMRVSELDEQWTCSDEEMLALRDKLYKDLAEIWNISVEDIKKIEDPNCPEAEKARIEEKIKQSVLGGVSEERIANMVPEDFESKSKKYKARLDELEKEMESLEKKEKKGTLTDTDRARMQELNQEAMAIQQDMMSGVDMEALDMLGNIGKKEQAFAQKYSMATSQMEQRLKAYSDKAAALQKSEAGIVQDCDEIAKDYEDELRSLYEQVYCSNDVGTIHALYDRADELMKNYRTRAAKIWLKSLKARLENTKKLVPEAAEVYGELVKEGLLPECALRRPQLNVVTQCEDILDKAYADFPQPEVLPYHMEAMGILKANERILYSECGFAAAFNGSSSLFDDFNKNSQILMYNEKEDAYYKLEGGNRTKLAGEGPFNFFKKGVNVDDAYGEIPLRKGGRVATFSKGRTLILHDGTMVNPVAMRRYDDRLEFIVHDVVNDKEDFYQCVYKL